MEFNETSVKGKWLEIKGDIQKTWGKWTDNELDKVTGDLKSIAGLIQQKFGETRERFGLKKSHMSEKIDEKKEAVISEAKAALK